MSRPVLEAHGLSKRYRRGGVEVEALRDVSISVPAGRAVAVMGPSGSGKTTFLNLLAGLDHPSSGEVLVCGQALSGLRGDAATVFRRRHVGFVFQFFNLLPTMTARDNVALPMLADRRPLDEIDARTSELLEAVGVRHRAAHRPSELSGGEQQRVAIARALAMKPRLLLADEPTGNLDSVAGNEILALLRDAVARLGLAIVLVTHSPAAAERMDAVLTMRDGRLHDAAP